MLRYSLPALIALTLVGCGDHEPKVVRERRSSGVRRYHRPAPLFPERDYQREASPPSLPPLTARPSLPQPRPWLPSLRGKKVVIDPGHGGKDPGARGVSRMQEKEIVRLVANHVGRLLQDRGATVVSTRTTDRFLELDARAAIAERSRADLFVSIHADSAPRRAASGASVYICGGASSKSVAAARSIRSALSAAGIECRPIQRGNFRVLVAHSRPAVLVECGFLTNAADAARLNTMAYRSKIAAAIARGIADHLAG